MSHPSRWHPSSREASYRRRTFERMVRQLNAGVLPRNIRGDRDCLVAAMETVQRQIDHDDDQGRHPRPVDEDGSARY